MYSKIIVWLIPFLLKNWMKKHHPNLHYAENITHFMKVCDENKVLRETLEKYANPESWANNFTHDVLGHYNVFKYGHNGYEVAEKTLRNIKCEH